VIRDEETTELFKGLANLASIVKQAQQMGGKVQEIQQKLKSERVVGSAGGGLVEVEANGLGEIIRLTIDPALVEKNELEMIEDLVPAAVNQANAKAKQLHSEAMQSLTEGLDLPGLDGALAKLTGTDPTGSG
jgi:DNA-binding YbaB/EbfC family protein